MKHIVKLIFCVLVAIISAGSSSTAEAMDLIETPMFATAVSEGGIPAIRDRLPTEPSIVRLEGGDKLLGRHGGVLRSLIRTNKDVKLIGVFGYARLVGWTANLDLAPDILRDFQIEEGRIFTLHLRRGHKWSDGHAFTAEDFRYWWEDVANNKLLSPNGPPKTMWVDGALPTFETVDKYTIRYTWKSANPDFFPRLAGASPLFIFRPSHYLKQYHKRYGNPADIDAEVKAARVSGWAALHHQKDSLYLLDNPEQPTLSPWHVETRPPSQQFVAVRNPYYHRVDTSGRQLPYIDRIKLNVTAPKLIPAKTGTGESDLQGRGLSLVDYTFLKKGENRYGYDLRRWRKAIGAHLALFPNFNTSNPVWRKLMRNRKFRRALSVAIDRDALNEFLFHGLARPSNNTVLPESPLYRDAYGDSWAFYDPDLANDLLDELGLKRNKDDGLRVLPNGKKLQIIVETAGEQPEQIDMLELIGNDWLEVGIELLIKPSHRATLRARLLGGEVTMSAWSGIPNALPRASSSPIAFVPNSQLNPQWPIWGLYEEFSGQQGQRADHGSVKQLLDFYNAWKKAPTTKVRTEIWQQILELHAEEVFSIGLLNGVPQPVVISQKLVNVPVEGLYNFEPGAFFGIHRPDTFWLSEQ